MKTRIIYEDDQVIVCHKPAGLATQTARVGQPDVVTELKSYLARQERSRAASSVAAASCGRAKAVYSGAKAAYGRTKAAGVGRDQAPYLGVVHRLDQPVEGLLIFAKTKLAAARLTAQLSKGTLNKRYYAVVCGNPKVSEGELVDYLAKDGEAGMARVVNGSKEAASEAKKAVLQYRVMHRISTPEALAMLDIHIDTGRFHQIRVQMSHAGMPLLGDSKYGDEEVQRKSIQLWVRNVALCAYKIGFEHPVTGKYMEYEIQPEGSAFSFFTGN